MNGCERKGGRMLIDMAERGERHPERGDRRGFQDATRLKDLGIDKTKSHRWQLLAWMDEEEFEVAQ